MARWGVCGYPNYNNILLHSNRSSTITLRDYTEDTWVGILETVSTNGWKNLETNYTYNGNTHHTYSGNEKILPGADIRLVTREDLVALADLGEEEGALEEDEETVIHNLLRLKDITVKEIMTPRVVMTAFESKTTIKEVMDANNILRFSRIPIYTEDADDIEGYVLRSEILTAASKDEFEVILSEIKKPLVSISVTSNVDSALDKFLQNKEQIALVKDEFGGTAGIVTMEDVVETLLGEEIVDELDEVEDMRELAMEKAKSVEEE